MFRTPSWASGGGRSTWKKQNAAVLNISARDMRRCSRQRRCCAARHWADRAIADASTQLKAQTAPTWETQGSVSKYKCLQKDSEVDEPCGLHKRTAPCKRTRQRWQAAGRAGNDGTGLNQHALLPGKFDVGRDTKIPFGDL